MFGSWAAWLAASAILAVAQLVYALFGFGAGLIAVSTLTLVGFGLRDVVVVMLLINIPVEMLLIARERRHTNWRLVAGLGLGVLCGVPVGTWLLSRGGADGLLVGLGAFLVGSGTVFLALPSLRSITWPRWAAPVVGTVAGVFGGLFGTAGPPVIVYTHLSGRPKSEFRATLVTLFACMSWFRLATYAGTELLTSGRALSAAALIPAVLAGAWVGHRIHLDITERTFRTLVSVALVGIGLLLLAR